MTVRVGLERYTVMAKHGYYEFEHDKDQPFVFTVWVSLLNDEVADQLAKTVNYADIQVAIDEVMHNSPEPIALMEQMANQIIQRLNGNELVATIHVRIEKPKAPLPHPGGLPVIEVDWARS